MTFSPAAQQTLASHHTAARLRNRPNTAACTLLLVSKSLAKLYRIALCAALLFAAGAAHAELLTPEAVDARLAEGFKEAGLVPLPLCSDELFLRRIMLDLAGRIPTLEEQIAFQRSPDRAAKIEELLASPSLAEHWADFWTGMLVGYGEGFRSERESLRLFLQNGIANHQPYDSMVKQMLITPGPTALDGAAGFLARHREEPMVRVARSFLGVRLDCARCHDHPFDRWTQEDYERMKRFFEPTEIRSLNGSNFEIIDRQPDLNPDNAPRYLTGATVKTGAWRQEFALFTIRSKPFARSFANRVWCQLMGRGIVHPPDDLNQQNPPVNPQLLNELAQFAQDTQFSLHAMARLICSTKAYQRLGASAKVDADIHRYFAAKPIKPLTGEQIYDSMTLVLGESGNLAQRKEFVMMYSSEGNEQEANQPWIYSETVQALMQRLNGRLELHAENIDELFQRALCRKPTHYERTLCGQYRMSDVAFALVFGHEFAFNY